MTLLGAGLLTAALALVFIFRAKPDGTSRRVVSGPLVSSLFPTLILGLIAFGAAIILMRLLG